MSIRNHCEDCDDCKCVLESLEAENANYKLASNDHTGTDNYIRKALSKYDHSDSYGVTPIEEMVDDVLVENSKLREALEKIVKHKMSMYLSRDAMILDFIDIATEALKGGSDEKCEHGEGLTDYCEPCGRVHSA